MNYKNFPIMELEELLHVDGTPDLQLLKEMFPDPVNPEDKRDPMAQYRVMLAIRQAVAREQRRRTLEQMLEVCGTALQHVIEQALAEEFTTSS